MCFAVKGINFHNWSVPSSHGGTKLKIPGRIAEQVLLACYRVPDPASGGREMGPAFLEASAGPGSLNEFDNLSHSHS